MTNMNSDGTLDTESMPEHNEEHIDNAKIKLLDVVALTEDIPEHNLKSGEVGTVVEILADGDAFEVEFSDDNGQMYKSLSFTENQLEVLPDTTNGIETMDCRILRNACLANAEELLNSAKLLKGKNNAHIRYHLAVLAMEEVGKSGIFLAAYFSSTFGKDNTEITYSIDNHVKKLFSAIFSPFIEGKRLTKELFEENKRLAKDIHERRKESLYTNPYNPLLPQDRMTEEEANNLVRLCKIRIEMAKSIEITDVPDKSKIDDICWFIGTSDEDEKRQFIFSNFSLDKLADLKDMYEWIKWLRQEFTRTEEEQRQILQRELEKGLIEGNEGQEPKWEVKFRIFSASHSVRQKALNAWNNHNDFLMKLKKAKNSNELICEFTMPKSVDIRALWDTALWRCRSFVAALNIASMGLFWWHVDKDLSKFYEKIWDIENKEKAQPELLPKSIDWGHLTLTESDFGYMRLISGYIYKNIRSNTNLSDALDMYLTGLALTSKSDIHLRLESSAFTHFFITLKTLLHASGDWDGVGDLKLAIETQLNQILPPVSNLSNSSLGDYINWGMQLEKQNNPLKRITLTEVIGMKFYCDSYFMLLAKRDHDSFYQKETSP